MGISGPNLQQRSRFCQVPLDNYQQILDHLPLPTALCLGLSCKSLWNLVSEADLSRINAEEGQKLSFQLSLERDLPLQAICYKCRKLHKRKPCEQSAIHDWSFFRPCVDRAATLMLCGHYILSHEILQSVLRCHDLSNDRGIPTSSLAHRCGSLAATHVQCYSFRSRLNSVPSSFEVVPRIAQGRLFIKVERCRMIDATQDVECQIAEVIRRICRHQYGYGTESHVLAMKMARERQANDEQHNKIEVVETQRCGFCATDSSTSLENKGRALWKLSVIAWKDLGPKDSPQSQPWLGHTARYAPAREHMVS